MPRSRRFTWSCMLIVVILLQVAPALAVNGSVVYTYDALGRLIQVTRTGTVNNGAAAAYTYDPANNRTNVMTTAPGGGGMALKKAPSSKDQANQQGAGNGSPQK